MKTIALSFFIIGFMLGAIVVQYKHDPPTFTKAGLEQIWNTHAIGP